MLNIIKVVLTLWTLLLIPIYWRNYGPQNFLWFSDISLFGTVLALWLQSPLLMSMIILITLPGETMWNVEFFLRLFGIHAFSGLADYMFDAKYSAFLRGLSLFHVVLPPLWIWFVYTGNYDAHALPYAILFSWTTLLVTYWVTKPQENINLVFTPQMYGWKWITPHAWLALLMGIALTLILLLHALFIFF